MASRSFQVHKRSICPLCDLQSHRLGLPVEDLLAELLWYLFLRLRLQALRKLTMMFPRSQLVTKLQQRKRSCAILERLFFERMHFTCDDSRPQCAVGRKAPGATMLLRHTNIRHEKTAHNKTPGRLRVTAHEIN